MNSNLKRALTYIRMSLLYMVLGGVVLYFAGRPVVSYIAAQGNMAIYKGAPRHQSGLVSNTEPIVTLNGTKEQSEFQLPEINSQYGTISCERIDMSAPVYYGDNDTVLQNGVGQYEGSSMPGEGRPILIGGHDSTYFAALEEIIVGDAINIVTDYGEYQYQVTNTEIAAATDRSAYDLTQDKEQLILYTCYPFGKVTGDRTKRYFVYCDKVSNTSNAAK